MALTAAALLQTSRSLVYSLLSSRIGAIFGMLLRRAGLSASDGLSCFYYIAVFFHAPENKEHTR